MKLTKFFALAIAALAFVGCGNDSNTPVDANGGITLKANKTALTIGDTVTFSVFDSAGQNVTSISQIYDPDFAELTNKKYTATETGNFEFFATCGSETSNTLVIKVLASMPTAPEDPEPNNFAFNHRAVLIDHTGLACGNCPLMMDNLHTYGETAMAKHYNEVTCHGGYYAAQFSDPAYSSTAYYLDYHQSTHFGLFTGYPGLVLNFRGTNVGNRAYNLFKNDLDAALNSYIKKDGADVGIALTVEGDEDNILCAVKVKSAVTQKYWITAWLLESGIYSPNQAGAKTDLHRFYNYAIRNSSEELTKTAIAGLEIGEIAEGESYDYACNIEVTSNSWDWRNMGVIVIVSAIDSKGRTEVVNSAYCPVGESKTFEYVE